MQAATGYFFKYHPLWCCEKKRSFLSSFSPGDSSRGILILFTIFCPSFSRAVSGKEDEVVEKKERPTVRLTRIKIKKALPVFFRGGDRARLI